MRVRATIGLTIDIDEAREMGLELEDNQVEEYAIDEMLEYLMYLMKTNEAHEVVSVEVLKEVISGRADEGERHGLLRAEELASRGTIKKVLVHEISRLARTNSTAHKFVENLESRGVSLFWKAQGIETLLDNGKRNPAASRPPQVPKRERECAYRQRNTITDPCFCTKRPSGYCKSRVQK